MNCNIYISDTLCYIQNVPIYTVLQTSERKRGRNGKWINFYTSLCYSEYTYMLIFMYCRISLLKNLVRGTTCTKRRCLTLLFIVFLEDTVQMANAFIINWGYTLIIFSYMPLRILEKAEISSGAPTPLSYNLLALDKWTLSSGIAGGFLLCLSTAE